MSRARMACLSVAVLWVANVSAQAVTWRGVDRLPGREPVLVKVDEKSRTYFRATPEAPLEVIVKGPARLRIVSRAELPARSEKPVPYSLRVGEGKKVLEKQSAEATRSTHARIKRGTQALGESRQMIAQVPGNGNHTLRVSVEGVPSVLLRLLTTETASRGERTVSLTPVETPRSVLFKEGEKVAPYYSVLPGKPALFRVVGPTRLDLISRLDFDPTMRGSQSYRLAIFYGRRREVEFKTTKALTATYEDLKDVVPSKFRRYQLSVGEGVHEIRVDLLKPAKGSVEVQVRIPVSSVGNEE